MGFHDHPPPTKVDGQTPAGALMPARFSRCQLVVELQDLHVGHPLLMGMSTVAVRGRCLARDGGCGNGYDGYAESYGASRRLEEAENGRTNLTAGEKEVLYDQNRSRNAGL